jgi:hypothetical protein
MNIDEIEHILSLMFSGKSCIKRVFPTCALGGDGVRKGFKWLAKMLLVQVDCKGI